MARIEKFTFNNKDFEMEPKQKLFCMYYVKNGFHGTKAAEAAGYSKKTATSIASALLAKTNISSYVDALKEDIAFCLGISAVDIAREYQKVGFVDLRKLFNEDGSIKKITEIDVDTASALASFELLELFAEGAQIGNIKKIKMHDKISALDKLAKMIGKDGTTKLETTIKLGADREDGENYV